jgi:hypothetical protein
LEAGVGKNIKPYLKNKETKKAVGQVWISS